MSGFDGISDLIMEYREESLESLDNIELIIMALEKTETVEVSEKILSDILGILHTFKGNSGMMGFEGLQNYIHSMEDIFKAVQSEEIIIDDDFIDFVVDSVNLLRNIILELSIENAAVPLLETEITNLNDFLNAKKESQLHNVQDTSSKVISKRDRRTDITVNVETDILRVDFKKLDELLNLMGELVINRTRLEQVEKQLLNEYGEKGLFQELSDTTEQAAKITRALYSAVMKVRMLPVKRVFSRFSKLVRDIARERNKKIRIEFAGENTEIDKTVIDEIGEPLLHLIRNAVDHGIEDRKERIRVGKDEEGLLSLKAYHESGHIIITVEDDGRGVDEEKLRKKTEEAGIYNSDELKEMNLADLMFLPGISTADSVSKFSGRGMGMDVVKRSLTKINGMVEVKSVRGEGTKFTIKLPLTLAIISALLVDVSGEQYAIPLSWVEESLKVEPSDIHIINNREVVRPREDIIPVVRLSSVYNLKESEAGEYIYLVIVRHTTGLVALAVDFFVDRQELVIKPLHDYLGESNGFAGGTVMGDGKIVLIVDIPSVVRMSEVKENKASKGDSNDNTE